MPALSEEAITRLIDPFLPAAERPVDLVPQLAVYLELLVRWNARMNLTAVRNPEAIVQRHFGESLFAGACLKEQGVLTGEILDLGSGAGFPGIPIQLLLPGAHVVLAESQGKKVAFLREAVRSLGIGAEVWPQRLEAMPQGRVFRVVALRAVDRMERMLALGRERVAPGGWLMQMGGKVGPQMHVRPCPSSHGQEIGMEQIPF